MKTMVKVCGITSIEDARLSIEAGAAALGFIFVPASKRAVSREQAASIIAQIPPFVDRVGVFMDADMDFVVETALFCGVSAIQLHGSESPEYIEELKNKTKLTILKSFRPAEGDITDNINSYPADAFLLDSATAGSSSGGTGIEIDRASAGAFIKSSKKPVILAGGMRADNVAGYIRDCRPCAVDVCSGTEKEPGIKDPEKLSDFFKAVSSVDCGQDK